MKKVLLMLGALLIELSGASAQITITSADVSVSAITAVTGRDTSSFIRPWASGANQVWDFSAYIPANIDTTRSNLSSFISNPIFPTATNASCVTLPFGSFCSYVDLSPSGMYILGLDNTFTTIFTSHQVSHESPAALVYPFPLNFGQMVSQTYVQNQLNVNTSPAPFDSVKIIYHRAQIFNVDGWGTLITPFATYQTLRMKKINYNLDSTFNHAAGGSWSLGAVNSLHVDTSFVWLANGLMEVATISSYSPTVHRYSFLKSSVATGLDVNRKDEVNIKLYPIPAANQLYLNSSEIVKSITCMNSFGQIFNAEVSSGSIDISMLSKGIYFLKVVTENGKCITQKFVKE